MRVRLTRDSVAAADDLRAPHDCTIRAPDGTPLDEIVASIAANYLPSNIGGGKATWSLASRVPIAVAAQQWPEPKLLSARDSDDLAGLDFDGKTLRIHATYHGQIDPDLVLEVLQALRPALG
jgi:hypothetical protein